MSSFLVQNFVMRYKATPVIVSTSSKISALNQAFSTQKHVTSNFGVRNVEGSLAMGIVSADLVTKSKSKSKSKALSRKQSKIRKQELMIHVDSRGNYYYAPEEEVANL